jgi:hypothetical protein
MRRQVKAALPEDFMGRGKTGRGQAAGSLALKKQR